MSEFFTSTNVPDLGAGREAGARPQVGERADLAVVADLDARGRRCSRPRTARRRPMSTRCASGPITAPAAIVVRPFEDRAGQQAHVGLDRDGRVDVGARRVDHRHAVEHPAPVDAAPQHGLGVGELQRGRSRRAPRPGSSAVTAITLCPAVRKHLDRRRSGSTRPGRSRGSGAAARARAGCGGSSRSTC